MNFDTIVPNKYEAIIVGLNLTIDLDVKKLVCNSELVVEELKREFEVQETLLQRYFHLVQGLLTKFDEVTIPHICREHNARADTLSRLATAAKKGIHRSVVYVTLAKPSIDTHEC